MTLLEHYDAGDRTAVWDEIHAVGAPSALDAVTRADVAGVVQRTVERAEANLTTIHQRLVALRYRFELPEYARVPAGAQVAAVKTRLLQAASPLPLILHAWFDRVGYASFRGSPPRWPGRKPWRDELFDPFEFVYGIEAIEATLELIEDDPEEFQRPDGSTEFPLEFSADFFHKNDLSGGAPTYASLPADAADALVFEDNGAAYVDVVDSEPGDEHGIWFVDYLRRYFAHGGFRRVRSDSDHSAEFFASLSNGLLPI